MYTNYNIEKIEGGKVGAFTPDTGLSLHVADNVEALHREMAYLQKSYEDGLYVGKQEERDRLKKILGL